MNPIQTIKDGAASATRIPAPLVISFVVYGAVALALTVPVAAGMNAWVGHRLTARDLARDFDGMSLLEPMVSASAVLQADTPPSADAMAASRAHSLARM